MSLAPYECLVEALRIFGTAILEAKRNFRPDVVICAIPENLAKRIWSVKLPYEPAGRETVRQVIEDTAERQIEMPFDWQPEETPEDLLTRDFRRALKAVAMRYEIPIQIVRRNALLDLSSNEPAAIRAWNLCAGVYYKAGGDPLAHSGTRPRDVLRRRHVPSLAHNQA